MCDSLSDFKFKKWIQFFYFTLQEMRHSKLEPDVKILKTLAKVADGRVPQVYTLNYFETCNLLQKEHTIYFCEFSIYL